MAGLLNLAILVGCWLTIEATPKYYMDTNCGRTISFDNSSLSQVKLYLTRHSTYSPNMHCTLAFNTDIDSRFMLFFNSFNVESISACTQDWLEVRDGLNENAPYVPGLSRRLCGFIDDHAIYKTSGSRLFLMFTSDRSFQYGGFQMVITSYHTGTCNSHEYECSNGRCINDDLMCNGNNPCGDYSDCPLAAGVIAGIIIGSLVFAVVVSVVFVLICRRRRRRMQRGYVARTVINDSSYGTTGYNQPVPQQYPGYPTGQQYPPQTYPTQ